MQTAFNTAIYTIGVLYIIFTFIKPPEKYKGIFYIPSLFRILLGNKNNKIIRFLTGLFFIGIALYLQIKHGIN